MKKAIKTAVLLLLCAALLLTGCAKAPNEPAVEEKETAPFMADYELLWETLETDYPYLDYLRDRGIPVDSIRESFGERVKSVKKPESFALIVSQMFEKLEFTAHLFMIEQLFFSNLYATYVLDDEVCENPFFEPWRRTLKEAAATGRYTAPTEAQGSTDAKVGNYASVTVTYYEDCKTLCLKIPTFVFFVQERDHDVLQQALEQYPEAENIVFDITGNSGGADGYWRDNLVAPFGEDQQCSLRMFFKGSPQNLQIIPPDEAKQTSELEDAPEWALKYGLDRYACFDMPVEGREAVHSDAKRWVLVDHVVYSSSEMFVCFCKSTGWATVAGKQTGGDGIGFSPVLRLLPDSGVLYEFNCAAGENPDGTMSSEGTTPDVVLESATIDCLLDLIRQERGQ